MEIDSHGLYGNFDRDEAIRRFPEVEDIKDEELREQVISVIREAPDYVWTAPAASHHHPPEHQARHGLWLSIKRSATAFERFTDSMVKQDHLTWQDVDYGRASVLLHDLWKYGIPPTSVDGTANNHDVVAAEWLDNHTTIPDEVIGAVEAHNGPWYRGKRPESHLEQMVHIADLCSSDENAHYAVKDPHPTLADAFPRVEVR